MKNRYGELPENIQKRINGMINHTASAKGMPPTTWGFIDDEDFGRLAEIVGSLVIDQFNDQEKYRRTIYIIFNEFWAGVNKP